jgi:hypothetical protein
MWKKFQNTNAEKLLDYDWLYYHYITLQETMKTIGNIIGVDQSVVSYHIRKHDIPRRAPKKIPKYTNISRDWWYEQYITLKRSIGDIGSELGVTGEFVREKLIFHGIKRRDPNDYTRVSKYNISLLDDKNWLEEQSVILNLSPCAIASKLKCHANEVRGKLLLYNISIKDNRHRKGNDHPLFGRHLSDERKEMQRIKITGRKHNKLSIQKMSDAAKIVWQNPERREKQSIAVKMALSDPVIYKNFMDGIKKRSENPLWKLHHSESMQLFLSIPANKKWWTEKFSGSNNPNWKGGNSDLYYNRFTYAFREYIREKYKRTCTICGKSEIDNKCKLDVHHVDYNKLSLCYEKEQNFVPLCHSCHTKTTIGPRYYYYNLLINYWVINSNIHFMQFDGMVILFPS